MFGLFTTMLLLYSVYDRQLETGYYSIATGPVQVSTYTARP
jgi:hypothetical protein